MAKKSILKKIFNRANIVNFLYLTLIFCPLLFIPQHNIITGFTNWVFVAEHPHGPVNAAALAVQNIFALSLLIFYIYNKRLQRKIEQENKEIDLAIKESEERRHMVEREYFRLKRQMQEIFDAMQDSVYMCSKDYKIEFMNKAMKKTFGDAVGRKCYEAFYGYGKPCFWCVNERVFKGEFIELIQEHPVLKRTHRVYNSPFMHPDGSISKISIIHDITELERSNAILKQSEDYFRNIFENLPVACFGYSREGKIVAWNKAAEQLYGFRNQDILGRSMFDTIAQGKDLGRTDEIIGRVFNGDSFSGLEWEDRHSDGTPRYVYTNTYPLYDINKEIVMGISANIDITSYKTVEKELKSSRDHLEKIMEMSNTLIVELDKDLVVRRFNRGCEEATGFSRSEALGKSWVDMFIPERLRDATKIMLYDIAGQDKSVLHRQYEGPIVSREGKERLVFWSHSNIYDGNGNFVCLIAIGNDITERKKFIQRINEVEQQQQFILGNLPIHFAVIDDSGKFIAWNKYSETMFGYTVDEVIGKLSPSRIHENQEDAKQVIDIASREGIFDKEIYLIHKDGRRIPAHLVVLPKRDSSGRIIGFYGFAEDITRQKDFRNQLLDERNKYQSLVMNLSLGVFRTTPSEEGEFLETNPALYTMFGYENKEEIMKHRVNELYYDSSQRALLIKEVIERGSLRKELLMRKKDGTPFWAEIFIKAIKDDSGKVLFFDGILKDINIEREIQQQQREIQAKLETIALKDPLTELYNARYIRERLVAEFERAKRSMNSLSLFLLDLDYFKATNELHGHKFGDKVLVQVGKLLRSELRMNDVVARWGGEEFIIILPDVNRRDAVLVANKVQETFRGKGFGDDKIIINLKCSIGVATYPEDSIFSPEEMIEAVEKSLFKVKGGGGDGVGFYHSDIMNAQEITEEGQRKLLDSLKQKLSFFAVRSEQSILEAIYSLSKSLELKDHHTRRHAEKMVHYTIELARKFGMSEQEIEDIRRAAILHDIGKLGIPDKILLKRGPLTKEEFEIIKKHPKIAADVMSIADFLRSSLPYVLHHHEHFDGKGYPEGLKGEEIPLGARILAVVDTYDALISDRPYHKAFSKEEALRIVKEESGTHFDSKVVDAFMELLRLEEEKK